MPSIVSPGPIVVATDLSEIADDAIRHAHVLAAARGIELVVLHVVAYEPLIHPLFPQELQRQAVDLVAMEREIGSAVERRVARIVRDSPVALRVEVAFGEVHATIVRRAEALAAGLVVVGAGSDHLGAVGARVVRYAHTPVLVVRSPRGRGGVLAATDLSDPAVPAIEVASREAKRLGVPLTVLHQVELGASFLSGLGPLGPVPLLPDEATLEGVRAALLEILQGLLARFGVEGDCRVITEGDAAGGILATARELDTELIVVGTHGRTGLRRIALGSVAETVIRDASCSVLAVRLRE